MFFPLVTALAMLGFGIGALRLNRQRPLNQALAAICFLSVLVFTAQIIAKHHGSRFWIDRTSNPLPWIRLKFAFIGLISPLMVWVCYYLVSERYTSRRDLLLRLLPWIALSGFLFVFPFTQGFKPDSSLPDNLQQGRYYYLYFLPILIGQILVCVACLRETPRLQGIRRIEFQFITIPLGYLSLGAVAIEMVYATWPQIPGIQPLTRVLSYAVYLVFGISAWSVTSLRVYHSGQVLLSLLERFLIVTLVCVPTAFALRWLSRWEPSPFAVATLIGAAFILFTYGDDRLRSWLHLKEEQRSEGVLKELHDTASAEIEPDALLRQFETILARFTRSDRVRIFELEGAGYREGSTNLPTTLLGETLFFETGWLSAISLARSPYSPLRLRVFLQEERLPVLVCARWSSPNPALMIGFGVRENDLPYTHPEVELLRRLAETVETFYTHARLRLQTRQSEQLAAINRLGMSVAHELRNPMGVLKSFCQLLPEKLDQREFLQQFAAIIPREVDRIESLAQQLLDLSKPRRYVFVPTNIHSLLSDTAVLVQTEWSAKGISIELRPSAEAPVAFVDPQAITQVIVNLARNAAEALLNHSAAKRTITLRTEDLAEGLAIEVEDNGPGLSKEIREKLFTAFASAGKRMGLGLGLAISQQIVKAHRGVLSADLQRTAGCSFRIVLPRFNLRETSNSLRNRKTKVQA